MSSDQVDDLAAIRVSGSQPPRASVPKKRRGLRVPIADVHSISAAASTQDRVDAARPQSTFEQLEPPSGVSPVVSDTVVSDAVVSDAAGTTVSGAVVSPAEASASVMQPIRSATEFEVAIPPTSPGLVDAVTTVTIDFDERPSAPPEELTLEEAEVSYIPVPRPPPPPVGYVPTPPAEAEPPLTPWFDGFFGEDYLATVRTSTPREVSAECDFIERALGLAPGARILDVGCGLGLQAVELGARGYQVIGLDISDVMLSRATAEAEDRGLQLRFVHSDMRSMPFERCFDGVLCWGTTFGYFDEADNEQAIRQFNKVLRPKGVLLLDVVNRDFMIGSQPNQVWFEVDGSVCMEETDFRYQTSRLCVKRRVATPGQGKERDREYSIRLYALHELSRLLEKNGFRVDQVSGREATLGVYLGVHSPKMIVRAERIHAVDDDGEPPPPVPDKVRRPSMQTMPKVEGSPDNGAADKSLNGSSTHDDEP